MSLWLLLIEKTFNVKGQKHEMLIFSVSGELTSVITVVNCFQSGPYFIMFDVFQ